MDAFGEQQLKLTYSRSTRPAEVDACNWGAAAEANAIRGPAAKVDAIRDLKVMADVRVR